MPQLAIVFSYILGLYVPNINSTAVILSLTKGNPDYISRLHIMFVWSMLESTSLVMGYFGIRSNKTTLGESIEKYSEIDINSIIGILGSVILTVSIYFLAVSLYISIKKGILYKLTGLVYILGYMYLALDSNIIVLILLSFIGLVTSKLLGSKTQVRSLGFSLIALIK